MEFGQVESFAISPKNEIYDGHQRTLVWGASKKFGPDFVVDVRVSSRQLTERERKKLVIYLRKGTVGQIDWDTLANNWEADDLLEWGYSEQELQLGGFDLGADAEYTRNIQAPIYTPKGKKPAISDLFNDTKTRELVAEIENADISPEEKKFLKIAALRHTVLNFGLIAEYYCHASELVQRLMEDSALIIIDFNKAIELGYVKLSQEVADQYKEDYGDD